MPKILWTPPGHGADDTVAVVEVLGGDAEDGAVAAAAEAAGAWLVGDQAAAAGQARSSVHPQTRHPSTSSSPMSNLCFAHSRQ
ncbi:hypothetical protein ACGFJT_37160 [Actinomadura geliboluensis]|uniref:hypothetical protein n=1 Tax=Actinomadura geliboluensis TaxID=882440 RepID=UPI0037168CD7